MRKSLSLLFAALLVLCFMLIPMMAAASCPDLTGLWVGGQLGLTIPGDTDVKFRAGPYRATANNLSLDTGFMAGATVGYDFMKYFGVALDYSWNGLDVPNQRAGQFRIPSVSGGQNTIAALVMLHYGVMNSELYPAGRIVPYVAIGPALVMTTMNFAGGSQTSSNIGLVAESGIDFYVVPKVSIAAAFRYKMAAPSFESRNVSIDPGTINTYGLLTRVTYHF